MGQVLVGGGPAPLVGGGPAPAWADDFKCGYTKQNVRDEKNLLPEQSLTKLSII